MKDRRPDLSRPLAECIDRALLHEPDARFDSAQALGRSLLEAAQGRRRPHAVAGWLIAVLFLLGIGAGAVWKHEHALAETTTPQPETVTTNSPEALRLYTESYRLGDNDNFKAALPLVKHAMVLDPSFALAHTWDAWCLLNTGAPTADVQAEGQRAVELSGNVTTWERLWIQASFDHFTGQQEGEIVALKALLKLRPNFYDAVDNLEQALMQHGLKSEGLEYLARRADLRPDNGRDAMFAGLYLLRAGDRDRGLRYAERARMVARTHGWFGGAQVAWMVPIEDSLLRTDYRAAAVMLDTVRDEFAWRPSAERTAVAKQLIVYNLAIGRASAAMRATELIDDPEMRHVNRATVAFHAGDPSWAREMRFVKGPVSAQDSRTFYLVEAGRFDDATRAMNQPEMQASDQAAAEVELAHIELKKGQRDRALEILEHARPGP